MKISYFHKYIHHDYVRFAKGELPDAYRDKKWDRVYVTTLFTFEWERTKKALEYALSVVKDPTQVYTGGILATLMPELIADNFPTIKNNPGLLNKKGTLGLEHEECIDTMTLDYGILDDIADQYVYPAHDAYFTYMTRGCGMRCQFCAVQTLEPNYIPYNSNKKKVLKHDGNPYVFSPYELVWDGDRYYILGWSDRHNEMRTFRVDRIQEPPIILDAKAAKKPLGFSGAAKNIERKKDKKLDRFVFAKMDGETYTFIGVYRCVDSGNIQENGFRYERIGTRVYLPTLEISD